MRLTCEIEDNINEYKKYLKRLDNWILFRGDTVSDGQFQRWVNARAAIKDTVHELEIELRDTQFQLFSDFLKKRA